MGRKIAIGILIIAVGIAAFFAGKWNGANLVRNGIVANYPNFKALITNAVIEKDSVLILNLNGEDHKALYELLKAKSSDSIVLTVPYHAAYGADLDSKYYRLSQQGNQLEAFMPKSYCRTFRITFDAVQVNGKNILTTYGKETYEQSKVLLNEYLTLPLSKDKAAIAKANANIAERIMWLFIPYKFGLKIYFDSQSYELPSIPGLNKDVDEYLKENLKKAS